jgi:hypothetical protein
LQYSPSEHAKLIRAIVEDFGPHFVPGGVVVFSGNTDEAPGFLDANLLAKLGIDAISVDDMPDVVLHFVERNWLVLIESATNRGPIDRKRHAELAGLFSTSTTGLVYVTAFPNRFAMSEHLGQIAWQTIVWLAEEPTHLVHFNGPRLLGPCNRA